MTGSQAWDLFSVLATSESVIPETDCVRTKKSRVRGGVIPLRHWVAMLFRKH